ncbi:MAG: hypothetical protein GY705_23050, partial [Bacteroidetes bacterium]|nr:hypothetical protein [Bacteroidota bacterium]
LTSAVFLLCGSMFVQLGVLRARSAYNSVSNVYLSHQLAKRHLYRVAEKYDLAVHYDPFDGLYSYLLGNVDEYLSQQDKAIENYKSAVYKEPLRGVFLQRLALHLPENQRDKATLLMAEGYERGLDKDELLLSYMEWLLKNEKRKQSVALFEEGLQRNKYLVTKAAPLFQGHSFNREEMADILGQSVDAWVSYGTFLNNMGDTKESDYYLGEALNHLGEEDNFFPQWFVHVYRMYLRKNMKMEAVEVLLKAIEKVPDYALFHVWLGDYFLGEGIKYRAKDEYQQALILNPGDERVRKKFEKL